MIGTYFKLFVRRCTNVLCNGDCSGRGHGDNEGLDSVEFRHSLVMYIGNVWNDSRVINIVENTLPDAASDIINSLSLLKGGLESATFSGADLDVARSWYGFTLGLRFSD